MKMFAKLKRVLAGVLTMAMLTATLTACGGGGGGGGSSAGSNSSSSSSNGNASSGNSSGDSSSSGSNSGSSSDSSSGTTAPATFAQSKTAQLYKQLYNGYYATYTVLNNYNGERFDVAYVTDFEWEYEQSTYSDDTTETWLMKDPDWYKLDEDNQTYVYYYQPTDGEFVNGFILIPEKQGYATLVETGTADSYYYERVTYDNELNPVDITYCYNALGKLEIAIFDIESDYYMTYYISEYGANYNDSLLSLNGYTDNTGSGTDTETSVKIDAEHFPDASFRYYLLKWYDKDGDGVLSEEEIAYVTSLTLRGFDQFSSYRMDYLTSLKGIEYFYNLEKLDCNGNNLTELDLSKNTKLTSVICNDNDLTSLDVSGCTELKTLICDNNNLTSLDISSCQKLESLKIDGGCSLTTYNNKFFSDDVLAIDESNFPDATFRSYISTNFDTDGSGSLSTYELANVTEIDVSNMGITSLEGVEELCNLKRLDCSYNQLTSLYLSVNDKLEYIDCSHNSLTSLTPDSNSNMNELRCSYNNLTTLNFGSSGYTNFEYLYCDNNELTNLYIYKNSKLKVIECHNNNLSNFEDCEDCPELEHLSCYNNNITSLDVSQNTELTFLSCYGNPLGQLDLSNNTALETLNCGDTQLSTLDVSNNTALKVLWCDTNSLSSLDISNNTKLETLACYSNNINYLDTSNNPLLTSIQADSFVIIYDGTSSDSEYNGMTAAVWGMANYENDNYGLCAEFVWNCLKQGGFSIAKQTRVTTLRAALKDSGKWTEYTANVSSGSSRIYASDNPGMVSVGDVIVYQCIGGGNANNTPHTALVCKIENDVVYIVQRNGSLISAEAAGYYNNNEINGTLYSWKLGNVRTLILHYTG